MSERISWQTENVALPALDYAKVEKWIDHVAKAHDRVLGQVGYVFCDDPRILEVNRQFLQHDYYTDIITFDSCMGRLLRGDIYLSLDTVRTNAEGVGETFHRELMRVIVHGILHLCGIDDKAPGARAVMERHEDEALSLWDSLNSEAQPAAPSQGVAKLLDSRDSRDSRENPEGQELLENLDKQENPDDSNYSDNSNCYDTIVVGAGHAGCEAAAAAARLGCSTLLITHDMNKIAQMSCNPAVGGIAKGQIVREIDALGGWMGVVTDRTAIQTRMLNRSKGPAMWSPRAQSDRMKFSAEWRRILENTEGLSMWQDDVCELLIDSADGVKHVCGVKTRNGATFQAKAVVLTNGTFLNGLMHIGRVMTPGGRVAEPASHGLTEQLVALGFEADRMKTGTPPRIDGRTVDWSLTTNQAGDADFPGFSYLPDEGSSLKQRMCHTVYTNPETHEILREALPDSPLYNGQIKSIGPRYCPSIETKIVTFADKESHQLFLEPEGEDTTEYYVNGFSSSLPMDVQMSALRTIPALRNVHFFRPGYAIEYDFFLPTQLKRTLETKMVDGLYFAGQINGTTGYEEAAGQGLMAGANAALKVKGREPFTLGRDEAYIGVLIDDLITKGVDEPYRMFTSRAEYRILLRQDNADSRLTPRAFAVGLADERRMNLLREKEEAVDSIIELCRATTVRAEQIDELLVSVGSAPLRQSVRLIDLVSRPQLTLNILATAVPELADLFAALPADRREEIIQSAEIAIKYKGYIERERQTADKIHRLEDIRIAGKFDYASLTALSTEARQKLASVNPETIAQASRIPGVSPADINILLMLSGR